MNKISFDPHMADNIIRTALDEDMPMGDITTDSIISPNSMSRAVFIAKQDGILAGIRVAERVFFTVDRSVSFKIYKEDGQFLKSGDLLAEVSGSSRSLLKSERTALNIIQRMSGIATLTSKFVQAVEGTGVKITDTRKTSPGIRYLEKYAVRVGGGFNHRYCLSDGVLIKDNHIHAAGGITQAVTAARESIPHTIKIEVETAALVQVKEAVACGADIIMLDNMDTAQMKEAVNLIDGRALTEASGNISLDNVRQTALTGVNIISVGKLTHSSSSLDISMKFIEL